MTICCVAKSEEVKYNNNNKREKLKDMMWCLYTVQHFQRSRVHGYKKSLTASITYIHTHTSTQIQHTSPEGSVVHRPNKSVHQIVPLQKCMHHSHQFHTLAHKRSPATESIAPQAPLHVIDDILFGQWKRYFTYTKLSHPFCGRQVFSPNHSEYEFTSIVHKCMQCIVSNSQCVRKSSHGRIYFIIL